MQVVRQCVQQLSADVQGRGLGSSSSLTANSSGHNNCANKGVQDGSSVHSSNASSSDAGDGSCSNINNKNSSGHPLPRPGWTLASAMGSCNAIEGARATDLRPACVPQLDPTRGSSDGGAAAGAQPALRVVACLPAAKGAAVVASEEVLCAGLRAAYKRFLLRLERKEAALLQCGLGGIAVAPLAQLQSPGPRAAVAHCATAGALGGLAATFVPEPAAGAPVRQPDEAEDAQQAAVTAEVQHERSSSSSGHVLPELPQNRNSPDGTPTAPPPASAFALLQLPPHLQPFSVRRTVSGPRGGRLGGSGRRMSVRRRGGDSSSPPAPGEDAEAAASANAAETGSPQGTLGRADSQLQQVGRPCMLLLCRDARLVCLLTVAGSVCVCVLKGHLMGWAGQGWMLLTKLLR